MDQKKNIYLECLCRKGIALCRLYFLEETNKTEILESVSKIWKSFVRFVDPSDSKVLFCDFLFVIITDVF
jgi:hypothetical protein